MAEPLLKAFVEIVGASLLAAMVTTAQAATTTLSPSGGDDTVIIQAACNKGPVRLTDGVFHVSSVSCKVITSENADAYFRYEGQQPTVKLQGTDSTKRGVLVCPSPGPCLYRGFEVNPPANAAGIVLDTIHGAQLLEMSVVDDVRGNSGDCVDMNVNSGWGNQNIIVRGGTYVHCGGWCFNSDYTLAGGWTSDSEWDMVDVSNCQKGGIHIFLGDGNHFNGNRIQDHYGLPGLKYDNGGVVVITGNTFDLNYSDMVLGNVWGVMSGNMSCRTQGGAMIVIEGPVSMVGSSIRSCGPTYLVGSNGQFTGGAFYDPMPSYADQHTHDVLSGVMR
jgi:hypothetical protein